jgi:hypothetical protein
MVPPQAERICKMIENLANRHRGEFYTTAVKWKVIKVNHPHYDRELEYLVPFLLIDWK